MNQVGLLTIEQKDELLLQEYTYDSYFYPFQDIEGNWIISMEEIESCDNELFLWVKDLPLILYLGRDNSIP